ncbi:hypothetical protein ACSBR2_018460 [Camellia fascicularis]
MVICGMGGIGKTTIAKTVYNQNFDRFEGSSFLANVTETSKQSNGLVHLQRQLLLDIFKRKIEKIHNVDKGIIKIKDAISCKNVLVILDDVDELDQVNAIFGMRHWFHHASKIIITTRHDRLLKVHEVCKVSMVKEFNDVEALRLFSWHAFGQDHPIEAYIKQAKRMTYHCGGLPLALKCLVTIGVDNKLMMHQLLRDMGREIIRQESPKEPGKRSRGTETIEGFILDLCVLQEDMQGKSLYSVQLIGGYENFPKKLRWLHWHGFPLKFIPNDFPLESLVVLDMRNSSLAQLWKGTKMLRLLKIPNLSHSHGLADSPDFSLLPNLEKLKLKDCINLVGVHESIGKLDRLVLLNLRGCRNLTKLPREIVLLKSLKELILSDCSSLDKLPPDLVKIESLKVLHADGINQLSSNKDLNTLFSLQSLHLHRNPICSLPGSLKGLTRLTVLNLADCTRLQSLPELPLSLYSLDLTGCRSLETVANLSNLYKRLYLDIGNCEKLVDIPGLLKLEPIGNIDSEMINNLSLTEWDFMGIVEFELYSNLTGTIIKAPTHQVVNRGPTPMPTHCE